MHNKEIKKTKYGKTTIKSMAELAHTVAMQHVAMQHAQHHHKHLQST
jgi:hypothetical protein